MVQITKGEFITNILVNVQDINAFMGWMNNGWQSVVNRLLHYRLFTASQPECSVLAFRAYEAIHRRLLRREDYNVTPQDIYQSLELMEVS